MGKVERMKMVKSIMITLYAACVVPILGVAIIIMFPVFCMRMAWEAHVQLLGFMAKTARELAEK